MKKNVLLDLSQEFAGEVIAVARILKDKGEKLSAVQIIFCFVAIACICGLSI